MQGSAAKQQSVADLHVLSSARKLTRSNPVSLSHLYWLFVEMWSHAVGVPHATSGQWLVDVPPSPTQLSVKHLSNVP